ncbi:MAG: hypothetical protein F2842_00115 [Actinobacteria bacterium]|uniref:Unannotated protein n=1 Tax=freshwater metagenome TaxID=449393 RepID=A0A6J7PE69_9ZZZZ|nr:hypothetical protein [Actinomycetota bacterium]MSW40594.1 hypothetical protein [Actinomycetota bacterium]
MTSAGARVHWVALLGGHAGAYAYSWRLLGPNNRELGRSTYASPTVDEAYTHVVSVKSVVRTDCFRYSRNSRGDWAWAAVIDDDRQLRSCREFRRERECVYNAGVFLERLLATDIQPPQPDARLVAVRASVFLGEEPAVSL